MESRMKAVGDPLRAVGVPFTANCGTVWGGSGAVRGRCEPVVGAEECADAPRVMVSLSRDYSCRPTVSLNVCGTCPNWARDFPRLRAAADPVVLHVEEN